MPNNKPFKKYFSTGLIVAKLTAGLTGGWGWIIGLVAPYVINYLAREAIYVINVVGTTVQTNMEEKDWVKIAGEGWAAVENPNLTPEEGKAIDEKVKKAFDKFTVFTKVKPSSPS